MAKSSEELVVDIKGDVSDLLRKLDTAVDKTEDAGDKMSGAFKKTGGAMSSATKGMGAFAVAAGVAATAMVGFSKVMDHINSKVGLARLADRTRVGVKEFQRLSFAARSIGVDAETLADGMKDLSVKITDASRGAQAYEDALNAVGLKSQELIKLSPEEQFLAFADAIAASSKEMGDFAADEINDSMFQMIPLLRQGSEGFKNLGEKAEEAGAILSESDLNELKEAQAAALALETAWDGVMKKMTLLVEGPLTAFLKGLTTALETTTDIAAATPSAYSATIGQLGGKDGSPNRKRDASRDIESINGKIFTGGARNTTPSTGPIFGPDEEGLLEKEMRKWENYNPEMTGGTPTNVGTGGLSPEEMSEAFILEQEALAEHLEVMETLERESRESLAAFNKQKDDEEIKAAKDLAKMKKDLQKRTFNQLTSLMNTESKKLFEVGKAAAIAEATIETFKSAQYSYTQGSKIGGPPVGAAFAAVAVAAGLNNINNIRSTSFGGGGGGASSTGGAAGLGSDGSTAEAPSVQSRNVTEATINITGDNFSGDNVRALAESLKEFQADGGELVIK